MGTRTAASPAPCPSAGSQPHLPSSPYAPAGCSQKEAKLLFAFRCPSGPFWRGGLKLKGDALWQSVARGLGADGTLSQRWLNCGGSDLVALRLFP